MKMLQAKEDNTVFVLQKAIRKFKIKISNTSIREFLLSHPHYPSLKSVCDGLTHWKIAHYPLKLESEEIKALEIPFIAHFSVNGGQLVFVDKMEGGKVTFSAISGITNCEAFEVFSEKLSGAVIVMEPDDQAREKDFTQLRQNEYLSSLLLPFGILVLILLTALSTYNVPIISGGASGNLIWGLIFTKSIGFIASVFLTMHELKIHSRLADQICGFNKKTDCDTVLSSNASRIFGWINWADIGLVYFMGTFLYLVGSGGDASLGLLAIIATASLPYPVFSIYYQSVKLKKWCPFCLMVQLVLIAEFIFLLQAFKGMNISLFDLLRLATSFLLPAAIWVLFKAYYQKSNEFTREHYSFLKFKRDPEVFGILLKGSGHADFVVGTNDLIIGRHDAPVVITAFLSLYCAPCSRVFKDLTTMLGNRSDIKIHLIFSVYGDTETQKVINTLYYTYICEGSDAAQAFLSRWYSMSKVSRKALYSDQPIPEEMNLAHQIGEQNGKLFEDARITGTPTIFVNGYKFPVQYQYSDLYYYIDDLIN
jgi:uncharacterized membrane protein